MRRNVLAQSRNPGHWFLLLVLPVVDGLLFGSIGVAYGQGEGPVRMLVTGIMLFHLVWQLTLAGSLGLLEEVWTRNLLNLVATPLTEREFLGSLVTVGLLRTVVSITAIASVGLGFYAVAPGSAGWVLVPTAGVLLLFGTAVTLGVVGLTLQYGDSAEVFSVHFLDDLAPDHRPRERCLAFVHAVFTWHVRARGPRARRGNSRGCPGRRVRGRAHRDDPEPLPGR